MAGTVAAAATCDATTTPRGAIANVAAARTWSSRLVTVASMSARLLVAVMLLACGARAIPSPRRDGVNRCAGDAPYHALCALLTDNPRTGAPVDSIAELLPLLDPELVE